MEFGRVIRSLDLMTTQVKNVECYSACVYAFMGGAYRYAGEGSLAIDRAMFDGNDSLTTKESLHEFGGSLVDYSVEMGVDPNVLKLAGSVPDGNPHFLTESEMKQYLVTTLFIGDDGKVQPALETTPTTNSTNATTRQCSFARNTSPFCNARTTGSGHDVGLSACTAPGRR